MNSNDDEISLLDLWDTLIGAWKTLLAFLAVGIALGVGIGMLSPSVYQATALIQVGQVGQVGQVNVTRQPVESPLLAVERLRSLTFQQRIAEATTDQVWLNAIRSGADAGRIQAQLVRATQADPSPLIELKVRAPSREQAKMQTEATLAELVRIHNEFAQPRIDNLRSELASNREQLDASQKRLNELSQLAVADRVPDARFNQIMLANMMLTQTQAEVFALRSTISMYETALQSPLTQPTRTIEPVFAPAHPVSPPRLLMLVVAAMAAAMLGVLWVLVRSAWLNARRAKKHPEQSMG